MGLLEVVCSCTEKTSALQRTILLKLHKLKIPLTNELTNLIVINFFVAKLQSDHSRDFLSMYRVVPSRERVHLQAIPRYFRCLNCSNGSGYENLVRVRHHRTFG